MDRRRLKTFCILLAVFCCHHACAGLRNDVPSCYAANNIAPAVPLGYNRLIYVLIDQTVSWNDNLKASIIDNINANLVAGTKFTIAEFSAFGQGRYLDVVHTGVIEAPMPQTQVGNTPIEKTRIFNACLADQGPYAVSLADSTVLSILDNSSGSLDHSDIMSALQTVAAPVAADSAAQKLLLLASDGLENSGATSFYSHGATRDIDPAREIKRAETAGLFGNFGGATVYVVGGALAAEASQNGAYRSPKLLSDLTTFWRDYFSQSNATLVEFGEPALLQPVQFSAVGASHS